MEETRLEALHLAKEIHEEIQRLGGNEQLDRVIGLLEKTLAKEASEPNVV